MYRVSLLKRVWIWCRRFRYRCGYGVHSPFAFNLITWVIYENCPFYAYEELGELRRELSRNGKEGLLNRLKSDKLLFRLVNWIQPKEILEIGTRAGLSTCYMAFAKKGARVVTLSSGALIAIPVNKDNIKEYEINDHTIESFISDYMEEVTSIDFVHFNRLIPERSVYKRIYPKLRTHSLLVIEGIHSSKDMLEWWNELVADNRTGITFDLYDIGLIFYDKTKIKQHYIVNF